MRVVRREGFDAVRAAVTVFALFAAAWPFAHAREAPTAARPQSTHFESPAAATLDPGSVDFGEQVIGRWSRVQRIVVTNTGGAALHVNSVSLGGDGSANYSLEKDNCTGAEVMPYRACVIDIAFLPTGKDDFDAELKLIDNAPDSPQALRITGEGINSSMVPPGSLGR